MLQKIKDKINAMNIVVDYRKMLPYVKPYWKRALIAVLITIPVGSMDAVIAWAMKPYMDVVMVEKQAMGNYAAFIPLAIIIFSLVQSLLTYLVTYLNAWVGNKISMDVKKALFFKLMHNNASFFDNKTSGEIMLRFNDDVDAACSGLLKNLKLFTTRFFSSISLICVLFYNSWQLAIIATIILFGALFPLTQIRKKLKGIVKKDVFTRSAMMTHFNETYNGNRIIASYNLYNYQDQRFKATLDSVFSLGMKMIKRTGLLSPLMHFIVSLGIAFVIWYGSYLILTHKITSGNFVSFIAALIMLYHPIKSIGNNFASVQMSLLAMERVFGQLEAIPEIQNCENPKILDTPKKNIEYKDVCFSYIEGKPVLDHINLKINIGETVAFVGNSGGGKSTLVNLLPRFYDATKGAILIDGTDIRELDIDSLREKIAIVFQDNFLFGGTIRSNIMLGKEDATEEEIQKAVECACLEEFINSLDEGLDTAIGERGVLLSGGQKQRIAIARAFLKNAPIVILDEATSALDNKSEAIVQQAIENLMADRTVFIIAHRLSTVRNADKIVVVNYGKIAEIGTHEELINKENGIYASLYKTQLK